MQPLQLQTWQRFVPANLGEPGSPLPWALTGSSLRGKASLSAASSPPWQHGCSLPSIRLRCNTSGAKAASRGVPGTIRAREHRAEPGPLSGKGALAGKVPAWERGASPVSHPGILLLIPLCQSWAWGPRSPWGGFSSGALRDCLEAAGGWLGRTRAFPSTPNFVAAGSGYPVASPRRGGFPSASLAGAAAWGPGERGGLGAILGPSVSSYWTGSGGARRLRFLQRTLA